MIIKWLYLNVRNACKNIIAVSYARRLIGQLCPNQRGNTSHRSSEPIVTSAVENTVINRYQALPSIVRSDRNQLHDGRSSELVVPIVVVNTVSFPSLVHTETRSIQRPVEQYSPSSVAKTLTQC